jgi:hypothetical protein
VRYRVFGGPVSVDQRLTVFEDGAAQLDERHRDRDAIWLSVDAAELESLRAALHELPPQRWVTPVRLALARIMRLVRGLFIPTAPGSPPGTHFELRWGRHTIVDVTPADPALAAVVELLDGLRVRAVQAQPR